MLDALILWCLSSIPIITYKYRITANSNEKKRHSANFKGQLLTSYPEFIGISTGTYIVIHKHFFSRVIFGVLRENNLHLVVHPVYSLVYPMIGLAWTIVSPIKQAEEQKKRKGHHLQSNCDCDKNLHCSPDIIIVVMYVLK